MQNRLIVALMLMATVMATKAQSPQEANAVGTLETNRHRVLISIQEAKPVYTVFDLQGNELGRDLSRDALFANFPELKSLISRGQAKDASLERGNSNTVKLLDPDK